MFKQALPTLEESFKEHCTLHVHDALWHNRDLFDEGAACAILLLHPRSQDAGSEQASTKTRQVQDWDGARLVRAIAHAAFHRLRAQEEESGFADKQPTAPSFFRVGVAGSWRSVLSARQVRALVDTHGTVMERLGYLRERRGVSRPSPGGVVPFLPRSFDGCDMLGRNPAAGAFEAEHP